MVTSTTSIYGLIGNPLEHSISPQIQNAAYREMGLDAIYICLHIGGEVPDCVRAARDLGMGGLNVTIPYKSKVIPALDEVDEVAASIGAVNVIDLGDGIAGYNTDVTASIRSLEEVTGPIAGKKATLIGAGGSARAVAFGLVREGAIVDIANRHVKRAEDLVRDIESKNPGSVIKALSLEEVATSVRQSEVLINATPVGMYPDVDRSIVGSKILKPDLTVMDLVYNPLDTKLLKDARECGCRTIGGLRMLVLQAVESIEIWTGRDPPIDCMMEAAREALSKYYPGKGISTN